MTIASFRGWQDLGKTALAVGTIRELCLYHGYSFDEVVANINLTFPVSPGCHCIDNTAMRKYVRAMVHKGLKHKIVLIDEADRVFPARFWHDKEQTDALLGLWQDYKLFNYILWTGHLGTSVDITMRQTTQIEIEPHGYDEETDSISFTVYDGLDGIVYDDEALQVSKLVFPHYNRWDVVT